MKKALGSIALALAAAPLYPQPASQLSEEARQFVSVAAPVVALIIMVALFAFDSLLNNFPNPIYLLSAGAVGSVAQLGLRPSRRVVAEPASTTLWPALRRNSWPPPGRTQQAESGAQVQI